MTIQDHLKSIDRELKNFKNQKQLFPIIIKMAIPAMDVLGTYCGIPCDPTKHSKSYIIVLDAYNDQFKRIMC